ncbi:hypothetical protein RCL1_000059 [Eukaryota sp. TZLM3-RCL]
MSISQATLSSDFNLPPPTLQPPVVDPLNLSNTEDEKLSILITPDGAIDAEEISAYAVTLENHRVACEQSGKYLDAQAAKNKLQDLRHLIAERKKSEVLRHHHEERSTIESHQTEEWLSLVQYWEQKERELDAKCLRETEDLKSLHLQAIQELVNECEAAVNCVKVRPSPTLLDLRRMEQVLVKSGSYAEAAKIKADADIREDIELERTRQTVHNSYKAKLKKLKTQQHNQLSALDRRICSLKTDFERKKQVDITTAQKRFKNALDELTLNQSLEVVAIDKAFGMYHPKSDNGEVSPSSNSPRNRSPKLKNSSKSPFMNSTAKKRSR